MLNLVYSIRCDEMELRNETDVPWRELEQRVAYLRQHQRIKLTLPVSRQLAPGNYICQGTLCPGTLSRRGALELTLFAISASLDHNSGS